MPALAPSPRLRPRASSAHPTARSLGRSIPRSLDRPIVSPGASVRVAIVIDDLGNDAAAASRIGGWSFPVSVAVLPGLPASARTATELGRAGKQVLLHLPMEPRGYPTVRPGPGVVLTSQSDEEIVETLEADLASVPGAVGVNNHMGSVATADARVMSRVVEVLARRGLFFVDSRTTDATVAESSAARARVPSASRRVFLDDSVDEDAIRRSLQDLVAKARTGGSAIGIGHPHASTLDVLERELPRLSEEGVRLVKVSELVK